MSGINYEFLCLIKETQLLSVFASSSSSSALCRVVSLSLLCIYRNNIYIFAFPQSLCSSRAALYGARYNNQYNTYCMGHAHVPHWAAMELESNLKTLVYCHPNREDRGSHQMGLSKAPCSCISRSEMGKSSLWGPVLAQGMWNLMWKNCLPVGQ